MDKAAVAERVAKARAKLGTGLLPIGQCHWCESPVHNHQLFCPDDTCATDWQQNHDAKQAAAE